MEGTDHHLQDSLLQEELTHLNNDLQASKIQSQSNTSVFYVHTLANLDPNSDPNKHRFSHYADKQLQHLVVAEQFDFQKIAGILNYIFREERIRFSELSCRERWDQLHALRERGTAVKDKRMEDKRATSVSAFSDPFSLYNLEEMIDKLQKTERSQKEAEPVVFPDYKGYNIFKNSIRQIDDLQQYKKRQKQMLSALQSAQEAAVTDKLMHFEPYYQRLNEFEVKEEELTEEKMKEIMSNPIEIERMEKELRVKDMNESNQSWKGKRAKKEEEDIQHKEHQYQIQDDWDQYQSD